MQKLTNTLLAAIALLIVMAVVELDILIQDIEEVRGATCIINN